MRVPVLLIGLTAFFVVAGPALVSRAAADDQETCLHGTGDEKIAACTRAINSGRWPGPELVWAYGNRGLAYYGKSDFDRAIADCAEAIRLDPKYAFAYNNRGIAYDAKGDRDRAFSDYNEAIRLDPKYAIAYNSRGFAYYTKRDNNRAIADYNEAIRLNPNYANAYCNRGLAKRAQGDAAGGSS